MHNTVAVTLMLTSVSSPRPASLPNTSRLSSVRVTLTDEVRTSRPGSGRRERQHYQEGHRYEDHPPSSRPPAEKPCPGGEDCRRGPCLANALLRRGLPGLGAQAPQRCRLASGAVAACRAVGYRRGCTEPPSRSRRGG